MLPWKQQKNYLLMKLSSPLLAIPVNAIYPPTYSIFHKVGEFVQRMRAKLSRQDSAVFHLSFSTKNRVAVEGEGDRFTIGYNYMHVHNENLNDCQH